MWHIFFFVSAVLAAIVITLPKSNPIRKIVIRTPVILGTLLKTRSFKDTATSLGAGSGSSCQDRCCSSSKGKHANMPDQETIAKMQKQYQMQLQMAERLKQKELLENSVATGASVVIPVEEDDLD